jgi:stage IV sporulation protein B
LIDKLEFVHQIFPNLSTFSAVTTIFSWHINKAGNKEDGNMKKLGIRITALLFLIVITLPQTADAARLLIPGGQVIGMALEDDSVCVTGFDDTLGAAAKSAGLQVGDQILMVDQTPVKCPEDIRTALSKNDGTVVLAVRRGKSERQIKFCPAATKNGPKLGLYLKQGVTGIGTVTWYDPQNGKFGALGHGVNTPAGTLLKLKKGSVYEAQVLSVKKGCIGDPGQLMGAVTSGKLSGSISQNASQGVFGIMEKRSSLEPMPTAQIADIHEGSAKILSTVNGSSPREYSVEILKIYPNADRAGRNMLLKVTDPVLLATTGGIVQGMSGSPIIQDGKLVGAVTHVLVNDPTTGYGIFIENMLDAAA